MELVLLDRSLPLAIYMEGASNEEHGKMGFGVLRYSPNPVACVIDSLTTAKRMSDYGRQVRDVPIVATIGEAVALGAKALVLGIAPAGGLIPPDWWPLIDDAVGQGLSIVNGLHDLIGPRYPSLAPGQAIFDVRVEPEGLGVGSGAACGLSNKRVLMIGTDMAVGKMTAGLEIFREALARGVKAEFVATGQIGITVTGRGIPLDAIRVDFAAGAVEREVMDCASADLVIIEGQGALIHPGSSATLPLMRGSCPTHFILCHRAGMKHLRRLPEFPIPPLMDFVGMYQDLSSACGSFPRPVLSGVALNTFGLSASAALLACSEVGAELGVVCVDPIRDGAGALVEALLG